LIRIESLSRRFHDVVAVDDLSLEVQRGEILGFVGPNGAGKSTTIRILTGFLPASSGRAEVDGFDVARRSLEVRRRIGYLPENVPLPIDARVDEYLEFRTRLKGLSRERRASARARVLETCGLQTMRRRIIGQLSRGYRQRVGLADALIADPKVLILDEPTGGLDPGQRQEVLDLVARLRGDRTVMLSSHVLAEVEHVCTRVAIIKEGRIVADGTRDQLEADAGRRGEVEILAPGATARLEASLAARGLSVRRPEGSEACLVRLTDDADGPPLLAALVEEGLPIASFRPLTRSLHEIFLDLTRSQPS
jgi:ABC-2 type transport system ATP-binding protein